MISLISYAFSVGFEKDDKGFESDSTKIDLASLLASLLNYDG